MYGMLGASIKEVNYSLLLILSLRISLILLVSNRLKKKLLKFFFLSYINKDFVWNHFPTNGTEGGILVGLNNKKF